MRRLFALGVVGASICALAVVPSASEAGGCATDWAMFQQTESHSANACSSLHAVQAETLRPAWFVQTGGDVTAEPAVVNGVVYVGDGDGVFRAIRASDGMVLWSRTLTDQHKPSYGWITSSAAVSRGVVFVGGGDTLWALSSSDGSVLWHNDLDSAHPASSAEIESSPVVWQRHRNLAEVIVGTDTNQDGDSHAGVAALNASTGEILWTYDPQTGKTAPAFADDGKGNECGDVWSSPALDAVSGVVAFGTGNCEPPENAANPAGVQTQSLIALNAINGEQKWVFPEPAQNDGDDDDFGSSPIIANGLVVQPGKSGYVYGVDERTGALRFQVKAAQWGQVGGAVGGFIATGAVGSVGNDPVFFGNSAIPAPFAGAGPTSGPDTSITDDPERIASLHAVDLKTGKVLWHALAQTPSYAPVTYTNGLVFAPATTSFGLNIFDAKTGLVLRHIPLAAAPSSGVAISGSSIYFGSGTYFGTGQKYPPQATGVWSFTDPTS